MNPLQPRTNHQFDPFEPHPELDGTDSDASGAGFPTDTDPFGFMAARGMPPPPAMPPSQVRREAREMAGRILANHRLLNEILKRHEARIQKRWEKKTKPQRLRILIDGWPNMPPTHRPDFAVFRKYKGKMNGMRPEERGAFVWPYVNQEDLVKPKALPLLLNARGRHHPTDFAAADGEAMHLGRVAMAIVPVFLNEHVMVLNGTRQDDEYGKLLAWEEHEDAFDWMHTRRQFLPGEGLCILQAQDRLLEFLVACCHAILHDIPAGEVVSDKHPIVEQDSPPSPKVAVDSSVSGSLAAMAEEAPYRLPSDTDFDRIESLLSARVARAEDHIWSLRDDPSYFADRLVEMKEHRFEMLKDTQGSVHPTLRPPREGLLWARVLGSMVVEAYFQLEFFTVLRDQAAHLRMLRAKHAADILPEKDLPEEYLAALLKFRHYLIQAAKGPMNQLKTCVPASPPFRAFFVREPPVSAASSQITVKSKANAKMDKTAGDLIWLLQTLWEDGYNLFLCRLPLVVDELDRLLNADGNAREMVSSYVVMLIGELSIVGECLRQVDTYLPWANGFENALVDREKDIQKDFAESTAAEARLLAALRDSSLTPIVPLADPSDHKFAYPLGKKRNKENIDRLRGAEASLDAFWRRADDLLHSRMGSLGGTALQKLLTQPRLLSRTPEWTEPPKRKEGKPKPDVPLGPDALIQPLSAVYFDLQSSSTRPAALSPVLGKVKVKTRGTAAASTPQVVEPVPIPEERPPADAQPHFKVNARALKVFRILFYDPAAHTTPGEIQWHDFLQAMTSTGFSAQKLYGSVWHFQPLTLDVERSIQFHEPHPGSKIPFLVARRYGRRLNRAFGWCGGMFSPE